MQLVTPRLAVTLLCLMPLIHGCVSSQAARTPPSFNAPVVVDLAKERCPAADPRVSAEWQKTTPAPKTRPCPESDNRPGICKGDLQEYADALRASEVRKNLAGQQQERETAACREPKKKSRPTS